VAIGEEVIQRWVGLLHRPQGQLRLIVQVFATGRRLWGGSAAHADGQGSGYEHSEQTGQRSGILMLRVHRVSCLGFRSEASDGNAKYRNG
jgi:hypothetical protein